MSDLEPRLADLLRRAAPPPPSALDEARRLVIQAEARRIWFRNRSRRRWALVGSGIAALLVAGVAGWTIRSLVDEPQTGEQPVVAAASPVSMPVLSERSHPVKDDALDGGNLAKSEVDAGQKAASAEGMAFSPAATHDDAFAGAPAPMAAAAAALGEAEAATTAPPPESPPVVATRSLRRRAPAEAEIASAMAMSDPAADAAPAPLVIPANAPRYGQLLVARAVLDAAGTWPPAERIQALRTAHELIAGIDHPSARELRRRLDAALAP